MPTGHYPHPVNYPVKLTVSLTQEQAEWLKTEANVHGRTTIQQLRETVQTALVWDPDHDGGD